MKNNKILTELSDIKSILINSNPKHILTLEGARKLLGFTKSYLYKLTYKKLIPHYKPNGKKLFFEKTELEEWITRRETAQGTTKERLPKNNTKKGS